jgi:hypothetical protein
LLSLALLQIPTGSHGMLEVVPEEMSAFSRTLRKQA